MRADREDGGGGTQQQQAVVMRLRHVGRSDALDHQLHAELVFIQDVCQRKEAAAGVKKTKKTTSCAVFAAFAHPPAAVAPPSGDTLWQTLRRQLSSSCLVYSMLEPSAECVSRLLTTHKRGKSTF